MIPRFAAASVACAVLALLPVLPAGADVLMAPRDGVAVGAADTPDRDAARVEGRDGWRVGALVSDEEAWSLPVGLAFLGGAAYGIHFFVFRNDRD
jgi:hypothetical protein